MPRESTNTATSCSKQLANREPANDRIAPAAPIAPIAPVPTIPLVARAGRLTGHPATSLAVGSLLVLAAALTAALVTIVAGGCAGAAASPEPGTGTGTGHADGGTGAANGQQGGASGELELVAGPTIVARRGAKTRVEVTVHRHGVAGELRLELGSLPHACRAEAVVLAADDTDTTLELEAPTEASYGGPWDVMLSATSTSAPNVRTELTLVLYVASGVGKEDASFHVQVDPTPNYDRPLVAARDPSGRLLVGGVGSSRTGTYAAATPWVMRFMPSGAIDTTFGRDGVLLPVPEAEFAAVTALSAGVAGSPSGGPAGVRVGLSLTDGGAELRATDAMVLGYDEAGVLDTGFGNGGAARVGASITRGAAVVQRIAAGRAGFFVAVEPSPIRTPEAVESTLWSLDVRGAFVRRWLSVRTASAITSTREDRVVTSEIVNRGAPAAALGLRRRDARGVLDETFGEDGTVVLPRPYGDREAWVRGLELEPGGGGSGVALLVWPATDEEPRTAGLVRFSASGGIDETFGEGGVQMVGETHDRESLIALDDGRWLVLARVNDTPNTMVWRFGRDGEHDTTFAGVGSLRLHGSPDDFIYAGAPDRLYRSWTNAGRLLVDRIWL